MSQHVQGVLMMTVAAMLIPLGDGVAKLAHMTFDVPISFLAWSRFALGAVLLAPFAVAWRIRIGEISHPLIVVRGAVISATVFLILQGAARAPLADVYGAFFIAPLISFLIAVAVLGERPGWRRTGLVMVGFCGVLMVAKPGMSMSVGLLFALAAGLCYGTYLTASRALAAKHRTLAMLWAQMIVGGIVLVPVAIGPHFLAEPLYLVLVLVQAGTSVMANLLIILAYRKVEASRLAPLVYVQLVAATLYGVLLFGTYPDLYSAVGLILLLVSGLFALGVRDRVRLP